jgi:hypothetical protein
MRSLILTKVAQAALPVAILFAIYLSCAGTTSRAAASSPGW